jgi:hypothetical protein
MGDHELASLDSIPGSADIMGGQKPIFRPMQHFIPLIRVVIRFGVRGDLVPESYVRAPLGCRSPHPAQASEGLFWELACSTSLQVKDHGDRCYCWSRVGKMSVTIVGDGSAEQSKLLLKFSYQRCSCGAPHGGKKHVSVTLYLNFCDSVFFRY